MVVMMTVTVTVVWWMVVYRLREVGVAMTMVTVTVVVYRLREVGVAMVTVTVVGDEVIPLIMNYVCIMSQMSSSSEMTVSCFLQSVCENIVFRSLHILINRFPLKASFELYPILNRFVSQLCLSCVCVCVCTCLYFITIINCLHTKLPVI